MGRLILHIGMHKTGSSSIQHVFARHRRMWSLFGVHYPRSINPAGHVLPKHNDLFISLSHEKDHGKAHPFYGPSDQRLAALGQAALRNKITVVTAEGLSGPYPVFARAFADLPKSLDVTLICVVRAAEFWAPSFYAQMVRSQQVQETRCFSDWLTDPIIGLHLDYAALLQRWSDALSPAKIKVVPYHEGHSVLPPWFKAAELPWLPQRLCVLRSRPRNPTPPQHQIEAIRAHRAAECGMVFQANPAGYFASELEKSDFIAQQSEMEEKVRARYRPDLEYLFPRGQGPV